MLHIPTALGVLLVPSHLLLDILLCRGCLQLQVRWEMAALLLTLLYMVLLGRVCHRKCCVFVGVSSVSQVT